MMSREEPRIRRRRGRDTQQLVTQQWTKRSSTRKELMRSIKQEAITVPQSADDAFRAALGVVQNAKNHHVLAAHNEGRKLVVREKPKMSNPKFLQVWVEDRGQSAVLHVVVGTDPRTPKALLDGRANDKFLKGYVADVQGVLAGSASAPATPVANHYLQRKTEIPWTDPDQDPQIELDGNILALYGL